MKEYDCCSVQSILNCEFIGTVIEGKWKEMNEKEMNITANSGFITN